METILTNGDEWTIGTKETNWPDWFAHGLRKQFLNLAKSETTNQIIYNDILDELINPKQHICAVVVFWTKWKDEEEMLQTFKYMRHLQYICSLESIDFIQGVTYVSQSEDYTGYPDADKLLKDLKPHQKMGLDAYHSLQATALNENDGEGQIEIAKLISHIAKTRGMFTCY